MHCILRSMGLLLHVLHVTRVFIAAYFSISIFFRVQVYVFPTCALCEMHCILRSTCLLLKGLRYPRVHCIIYLPPTCRRVHLHVFSVCASCQYCVYSSIEVVVLKSCTCSLLQVLHGTRVFIAAYLAIKERILFHWCDVFHSNSNSSSTCFSCVPCDNTAHTLPSVGVSLVDPYRCICCAGRI